MKIKTTTWTTHDISVVDVADAMTARIDGDNMVRLIFPQIHDYNNGNATSWLSREELLQIRCVINRVLDMIP